MPSPTSQLPSDRPRLEERLRTDLLAQKKLHGWQTVDLEKLRELETRIQVTAQKLEPGAPETAISSAGRELTYADLTNETAARAFLPTEADFTPEPLRIHIQYLESGILDLARNLEPTDPTKAIALATSMAQKDLQSRQSYRRSEGDPSDHLDEALDRFGSLSRRLKRRASYPQPTSHQRVRNLLGDLRRLDLLGIEHRRTSEARRQLSFRGNVIELRSALNRTAEPRDLLMHSLTETYRYPGFAGSRLDRSIKQNGLQATIDRFGEDPAVFGKLRGLRMPVFGDSPERSRALDLARQRSGEASIALVSRERLERHLESAATYQRLQNKNRDLADAYPSREKLLAELGRHMEGLEIHEVRPFLRRGQARLVQDLRKAELTFLEPLRKAGSRFRTLDAGGVQAVAQAQKIAGLFQEAPRHILKRLTPPQMQVALVAYAIASRATKVLSKAASV